MHRDERIAFLCNVPSRYYAWEAALALGEDAVPALRGLLAHQDTFVREAALEALVRNADPDVIAEIRGDAPPALTAGVQSLARVRAPYAESEALEVVLPDRNPDEMYARIRNIVLPTDLGPLRQVVRSLYARPASADDLRALHAAFCGTQGHGGRLRSMKLWDYGDEGGTPIEPHGQTYLPPAAIPHALAYHFRTAPRSLAGVFADVYRRNAIHPFPDENGRVNVTLMNVQLARLGVAPIELAGRVLDDFYAALNARTPEPTVRLLSAR